MARRKSDKKPVHFSMLRDYRAADLITLANAAAGMAAVLVMMGYLTTAESWRVYLSLALIPVALFFDIADGRVARRRGQYSPFGQELDSLADIVSFGVAPAALGYGLGLRGGLDMIILIFFVACGISRLARYNVTANQLSDDSGKVKYFEGTPIPTSLVLVALLALCFYFDLTGERLPLGKIEFSGLVFHPFALLFFANGCTMISKTLKIPKL
ncbi:MAG TPA: CDP-diacylglycerol--serine O-phosphatidyltransferase [Candidatus Binatia bacterium]